MADAIDMTEVDGVLYRPEDVERAKAIAEGRPETPAPFRMVEVDGVQYRPEDAKRLGLTEEDADDDGQPDAAGGPDGADAPAAPRKRQSRRD